MPDAQPGYFIVIDGPNGAGKSTQVEALRQALVASGYDTVVTKEPGGTPEANRVREILLNSPPGTLDGISELLLFSAGRRIHVENLIKPALAAGKVVLCDRFVASTVACQGNGWGLPLDIIASVTEIAIDTFEPDLTVVLLIDPQIGMERANRHRQTERQSQESMIGGLELEFHQRIYAGFEAFVKPSNSRMGHYASVVVGHDDSSSDVTKRLLSIVGQHLKLTRSNDAREQQPV